MAKKRKDVLSGDTYKIPTECGNLYFTMNRDEGEIIEVRCSLGKAGNCVNSLLKYISILHSILLQELDTPVVIKTLTKHGVGLSCGSPFFEKGEKMTSCVDKMCKLMVKELKKEGKK